MFARFRALQCVALAGLLFVPAVAEAGLLTHWTFDEGAGPTVTDSVNGNVGTLQGDTSFSANTPSGGGWSMFFDGASDRIVVPDSPSVSPTGNITLSAWVNSPSFAGAPRNILAKDGNNAYRWRNEASGEPWLLINDGGGFELFFSGGNVPTGGWRHTAVTANFDDYTARFYVDGVQVGVKAITSETGIANTGGPLVIGAYNTGGAESFNGNIDDVAVYDHVLAPNQIAALAAGTAPGSLPAAVPPPPSGFTFQPFNNTAESGIHWTKPYTHAANVRGPAVSVYGVPFEAGETSGTNWTLNGTTNQFSNAGAGGISGNVTALINNFRYGPGNNTASLTLTGLNPGERYLTTWYNSSWGAPGGRIVGITASDGNFIAFDENFTANRNGNLLQYEYVAPAGGSITYTFENGGATYHHYAFTNESLDAPLIAPDPSFATAPLTSDADSGIAIEKLYTHAINFDANGMLAVNGVHFQGSGAGVANPSGGNFTTAGFTTPFGGTSGNPVTGAINGLLTDFVYNPNGTETITLTGLLPGQEYIATFYNTAYGDTGNRIIDVATSQGKTLIFDQNDPGGKNGHLLTHRYVADSTTMTFTFTPQGTNQGMHQYALSNEMAGEPNMHLDSIVPCKQVLLTDSFNSGVNDYNVSTNVAARQTGLLAPLTYTEIGSDYQQQVGNTANHHPNNLLLADAGFVGINHNFNGEFSDGGLIISFDLDPNWNQDGDWAAITLGADDHNHNGWVNRPQTHFGILFRGNGMLEAWDGDTNVTVPNLPWGDLAGSMHHFDIVLTDTVNANPFDGYGTTVIDVLVNGNPTPVFSFVKGDGGYLNNYIGFQGLYRSEFDNLVISEIIPEPTTLTLCAFGLAALVRRRRKP